MQEENRKVSFTISSRETLTTEIGTYSPSNKTRKNGKSYFCSSNLSFKIKQQILL